MDRLRVPLHRTMRRAASRWRPVLQHDQPWAGFPSLGWRERARLELAVLSVALRRARAWRAALRLAAALLLTELLRGYWSLEAPVWQFAQCLLGLAVLPAAARGRQAILRVLLARRARRAGERGHGVL